MEAPIATDHSNCGSCFPRSRLAHFDLHPADDGTTRRLLAVLQEYTALSFVLVKDSGGWRQPRHDLPSQEEDVFFFAARNCMAAATAGGTAEPVPRATCSAALQSTCIFKFPSCRRRRWKRL